MKVIKNRENKVLISRLLKLTLAITLATKVIVDCLLGINFIRICYGKGDREMKYLFYIKFI